MPATTKNEDGLSESQMELLERLQMIATWLAAHGARNKSVLAEIRKHFDHREKDGTRRTLKDSEARRWLRRGKQYITSGLAADSQRAKHLYVLRLQEYILRMLPALVTDEVERIMEPGTTRNDKGENVPAVVVTKTKMRSQVFHPQVMALILRAEKEIAKAQGVLSDPSKGGGFAPGAGAGGFSLTVLGMPGSSLTMDMTGASLAKLLGGRLVEQSVLPQQADHAHAEREEVPEGFTVPAEGGPDATGP